MEPHYIGRGRAFFSVITCSKVPNSGTLFRGPSPHPQPISRCDRGFPSSVFQALSESAIIFSFECNLRFLQRTEAKPCRNPAWLQIFQLAPTSSQVFLALPGAFLICQQGDSWRFVCLFGPARGTVGTPSTPAWYTVHSYTPLFRSSERNSMLHCCLVLP
jgi:hypothetical protein